MNAPLAIVLAAGKGTRMKSDLPKVLFPACGRPMIEWVLDALDDCGFGKIAVVVGYRADLVRKELGGRKNVVFVDQPEQLGTGHAVMCCRTEVEAHDGAVLVATGDSPLIQRDSIRALLGDFQRSRPACLLGTLEKDDPTGLGRIVRNEAGEFEAIVEEKDASPEQKAIREVNMSTYVFDAAELAHALSLLDNDNQQSEYYITDGPGILKREGKDVRALPVLAACEAMSVNTVDQLAEVEAEMRRLGYDAPASD